MIIYIGLYFEREGRGRGVAAPSGSIGIVNRQI
jgi:hypothetical protein